MAARCPNKGAIEFFRRNAGYSYGRGERRRTGQLRSARAMAAAECILEGSGREVKWEEDRDGHYSARKEGRNPDEVLCATLRGDELASLCGIEDPTRQYGRVIEAELAAEAFPSRTSALAAKLQASRGRPVALGRRKRRARR